MSSTIADCCLVPEFRKALEPLARAMSRHQMHALVFITARWQVSKAELFGVFKLAHMCGHRPHFG